MTRLPRQLASLLLSGVLLLALLPPAQAADRTLLLEQAQALALSNSSEISKKNNQIILKRMKYVEAVKGIQAKIKDLRSFRWSPLLSFKFPQKLKITDEFDMNIKPLNLQADIDILVHELGDLRYPILAEVNKTYTELYVLQERIAFTEERLTAAQAELTRNQARLRTGLAAQEDVDKMQTGVDTLTTELSTQKRSFEQKKETLGTRIGLDITSGYTFRNSLKTLSLPREKLPWVIDYTLANDQAYYQAKLSASTALLNLNAYENLMRQQYGGKMDPVQPFINMARQGMDVDYAAFQLRYNEMLKQLDRPWDGKFWILFFRFPREWLKGEISGTRYIQDEMYAVYTACMEYAAARKDAESTEKELRSNISDSYESIVTAYNAYTAAAKLSERSGVQYDKVSALNQLGRADYGELKDARDSYQDMQLEMVDALAAYNTLLYDFDRLTCGAVTQYMNGGAIDLNAAGEGDSYASIDPIMEPYYYLYSSVADLSFHLGVHFPKEFTPAVSHYELWIDGVQIGTRTPVAQEVYHLALDHQDSNYVILRFFDGDSYVTECEIDTSIPRDRLNLRLPESKAAVNEVPIGTYSVKTASMGQLSTSVLTLGLDPSATDAKTYSIVYGEHGSVYTSEPLATDAPLSYLTLLIGSLSEVTLKLYDSGGTLLQTARFDTDTQTIYAKPAQP